MRALRLRGRPYPRKKPRTRARGTEPRAKNLLNQEVQAPAPNPRWVSDITDIRTGEGWLYLAAIRDLYSQRIAWSLGQRLTTSLAIQAFERARQRRRPPPGLTLSFRPRKPIHPPRFSIAAAATRRPMLSECEREWLR